MFWYNVIRHNSSYYFKMYISEITKKKKIIISLSTSCTHLSAMPPDAQDKCPLRRSSPARPGVPLTLSPCVFMTIQVTCK